jgi:hypothetical protein
MDPAFAGVTFIFVMAGLVPAIHVFLALPLPWGEGHAP